MTPFQLKTDTDPGTLEEVRAHCLRTIKDAYGYDYRPDWHWDLDSLQNPPRCPYFAAQSGAFYALKGENGDIIGTAAIRGLVTSENILQLYGGRYSNPHEVAYLCRVYIDRRHRKRGLGDLLVDLCREAAASLGYRAMYFHCERRAHRLRAYWESHGFSCFAEDGMSAHYEGPLPSPATRPANPIAA